MAVNKVFFSNFCTRLTAKHSQLGSPNGAGDSTPEDWNPPHYGFDCVPSAYAQAKFEQA